MAKGGADPGADEARNAALIKTYKELRDKQPEAAIILPAVDALLDVIRKSTESTILGLMHELTDAAKVITNYEGEVSVSSGVELFQRFVTRLSREHSDFETCKEMIISRGEMFGESCLASRDKIANFGEEFIHDGGVVFLHGFSRVVLAVLETAAKRKRFSCYVTESPHDNAGKRVAERLTKIGVPTTIVLDSSIAHVMGQCDCALIGGEGVVENGGVINKIGSYQLAIVAQALNKKVYVAAESFKFLRYYPLSQADLEDLHHEPLEFSTVDGVKSIHHRIDYTPPQFVTLLFTDLGVFTPSAVSDELIKMHS